MGFNTVAQPWCAMVIGRYNTISGSPHDWIETEPVFVIGNGFSSSERRDAFTILKNGDVGFALSNPQARLHLDGSFILGTDESIPGFGTSSLLNTDHGIRHR